MDNSRIEHILSSAELTVSVERLTAAELPRDLSGTITLGDLKLDVAREHPLFNIARQRDQSRVWTSALFLTLE